MKLNGHFCCEPLKMDQGFVWLRLILPHCDFKSLLRLRETGRWFCFTLLGSDEANWRVWKQHTRWQIPRLCHSERELGWPGVKAGMTRQLRIQDNITAKTFRECVVSGARANGNISCVVYIAGRLLVGHSGEVMCLYDVPSGAIVATFEHVALAASTGAQPAILLDRWIPVRCRSSILMRWALLDCATAVIGSDITTTEPRIPDQNEIEFSALGPHFTYRRLGSYTVNIAHVDKPACVVRSIQVSMHYPIGFVFGLCNNGESYLLYDEYDGCVMHDVRTGLVLRSFGSVAVDHISSGGEFVHYQDGNDCFVQHIDADSQPVHITAGADVVCNDRVVLTPHDGCRAMYGRHSCLTDAKTGASICLTVPQDNIITDPHNKLYAMYSYGDMALCGHFTKPHCYCEVRLTYWYNIGDIALRCFDYGVLCAQFSTLSVRVICFN